MDTKEKTAEEILRDNGIDIMTLNDEFNSSMLKAMEEYAEQKLSALQSEQKDEKCSFCGWPKNEHRNGCCYHYSDENTDYFYRDKYFQSSPAKEVEKPDREAQEIFEAAESFMKKLLPPEEYGESYDAEALYHALEDLRDLAAAPDLLKENQSLKERVKELEQEVEDTWKKVSSSNESIQTLSDQVEQFTDRIEADILIQQSLQSRVQSLEAENEELRKKREWISVKERLPLTDEYVLITDGIEVWVGNYERSGYRGRSQWGQAFIGCSMVDDTEITHWQPLPSKPEN